MRLKEKSEKYLKITFVSPSKNSAKKEEKKQEVGDDLSVRVLNLLPIVSILPILVVISLVKVEI